MQDHGYGSVEEIISHYENLGFQVAHTGEEGHGFIAYNDPKVPRTSNDCFDLLIHKQRSMSNHSLMFALFFQKTQKKLYFLSIFMLLGNTSLIAPLYKCDIIPEKLDSPRKEVVVVSIGPVNNHDILVKV